MKKFTHLLSATMAVLCAASPALAADVNITAGHMDLDIDYVGGVLSLDFKTYTSMTPVAVPVGDDVAPVGSTSYPIQVALAETYVVPTGATWSCLGTSGSTVYRLRQTQLLSQVWLGYNTQDVPAATFVSNQVRLNLVSVVSAPAGAKFIMYATNGFGTPTYLLNSNTGLCSKTSLPITNNIHNHSWYAFTAPGTYIIRYNATGTLLGGLVKTSANVDVTYKVQ